MRSNLVFFFLVSLLTLTIIPIVQTTGINESYECPSIISNQHTNFIKEDHDYRQTNDTDHSVIKRFYDYLLPMRDLSIPEIDADRVWSMLDSSGLNVTGEGILIADIDTGVDWRHPDLWFADGESYDWIDENFNGYVDSGDGIDLDRSGDLQVDESLDIIDVKGDGSYSTELDWIWVESVTDDGVPQTGERFFLANDTNDNDILDIGEHLTMLNTPKTKYIVETDGGDPTRTVVWERGVNLTLTTHEDSYGHGTAVSGILLGGHPEFRRYTGVAPGAELMMLNVYGSNGLTMLDALKEVERLGADLIITEVGQWSEVFMDGSSEVELKIDELVSKGIPVISPAGNLGDSRKHMMVDVTAGLGRSVDFDLQAFDSTRMWVTLLSVNQTSFSDGTFVISVPNGGDVTLNPGTGYRNWGFDTDLATNTNFASYIDVSHRNTQMLHFEISHATGLEPNLHYSIELTLTRNATVHGYVFDEFSGWSGGSQWPIDYSNNYTIAWPATADKSISVSSYHTRSYYGTIGAIAAYSGRGPRIDGKPLQTIAAPGGYDVISDYTNQSGWGSWYAGPGGILGLVETFAGFRLFSGTSAAGPHVAGSAALMLQANLHSNRSIGDIIRSTARQDGFTGSVPNSIWGYGKLNVSAAVIDALDVTPPVIHSVWRDIQYVEYDDTVTIVANVSEGSYPIDVFLRVGINDSERLEYRMMTLDINGNYTYSLGTFTYESEVYYSIYVNDTVGSLIESTAISFLINDFTAPSFSNLGINPQPAGIGATVSLTIEVFEQVNASGLAGVFFNYTLDSWFSQVSVEMIDVGSFYSGNIPGQSYNTTVGYVYYAVDNAGNLDSTSMFNYSIIDDNSPMIGTPVHSPTQPNSTQIVEISVTVTDESSVNSVILGYFNGSHWNNASMTYNGTYYVADIPGLVKDTQVFYKVYAYDEIGNSASSSQYSYTVHDELEVTTTISTSVTSTTETTTSSTTPNTTNTPDQTIMMLSLVVSISFALIALVLIVYKKTRIER
ncbi:MAG: S8 family serine peptidase [Candidatus Thorarchaeota archaeon]